VYHINKQNVYIGQREGQKTNKYYYNLSGLENMSKRCAVHVWWCGQQHLGDNITEQWVNKPVILGI